MLMKDSETGRNLAARNALKPKSVIRLFHAYTTFFLLSFLPIFSYNGTPLRLQTDKKSNQK